MVVRAEKIDIVPPGNGGLPATVADVDYLGSMARYAGREVFQAR